MNTGISVFPASYAQRRLWFIQKMSPLSPAYNMVFSTPLPSAPDHVALQWALNALAARHENLRTFFQFENGEPVQVVCTQGGVNMEIHALREPAQFAPILSDCAAQPFNLSEAPLARVKLATFADSQAILAIVIHHIIADGRTIEILMEDLNAIYRARVSGQLSILPELTIQYADYTVWQQRSLQGRRLESLTEYWMQRLEGLPELELQFDRPRPANGSVRGSVLPLNISADIAGRLRMLAMSSRTTLFAVLLAGLSAVLARFSGQTSFAIGIPVSARTKPELERVAGLFVNSIIFRADMSGGMSFEDLVLRAGANFTEDLAHMELPFEVVVDALHVKRRADRNPLFQVMLQLQMQRKQDPLSDEKDPHLDSDKLTSQLDISFILYETQTGGIEGGAVFAADLFDQETIVQLTDAYILILDNGSRQSTLPINELPILSVRKRDEILALEQGESRSWPRDILLHEWFEDQARRSPNSPAVHTDDDCLSFEQLDQRSNQIAAGLQELGVKPGSIVAVCLPRSSAFVVAVLGVLKAGAAYLVLDPLSPGQRLEFIVSDCDAAAIIIPKGWTQWAFGCPALELDNITDTAAAPKLRAACSPQDPAYVIYTSGSTGQPKGVLIPHGAIVNHMRWMLDCFPLKTGDRVLQRTPLTFDASVWELWAPLLAGTLLVLAPADGPFDPGRMAELIQRNKITTLQVVPSLLRALLDHAEIMRCTTLRRVFCGGEVLSAELRDRFFSQLPAELCNLYGPTETTIDATFHLCVPGSPRSTVPIGRPIANVVARVLDPWMQPVPSGVVGELFIGGQAVGLGYINRPELTAERFLDDPWAPGGKLFRTGDRARMLRDGELHFHGRSDDQVKLRGFRIELGEIDAVLMAHPSISEAAALVQDHGAGDQRLVAFVVAISPDTTGLVPELLGWVRSRLPAYQVPATIYTLASLPKTPHGKIDRSELAQLRLDRKDDIMLKSTPRNELERQICGCFGEFLGIGEVGIDDDFFLLGGHSLLVVSVCGVLSGITGIEVTVVDIFEYPTARQLADALATRSARQTKIEPFTGRDRL